MALNLQGLLCGDVNLHHTNSNGNTQILVLIFLSIKMYPHSGHTQITSAAINRQVI